MYVYLCISRGGGHAGRHPVAVFQNTPYPRQLCAEDEAASAKAGDMDEDGQQGRYFAGGAGAGRNDIMFISAVPVNVNRVELREVRCVRRWGACLSSYACGSEGKKRGGRGGMRIHPSSYICGFAFDMNGTRAFPGHLLETNVSPGCAGHIFGSDVLTGGALSVNV